MKKITILFLLLINISTLKAQEVKLETNYPEPRVGQSFNITLQLDFIEDYLKESLQDGLELSKKFAFSDYSRDIKANEAGQYTIGPLSFEFNGKTYKSDSITINVIEPLTKKEGIWIRQVEFDETTFLILEQFINKDWDTKDDKDGNTFMSISSEDIEFASIQENPIDGLTFSRRHSITNTMPIDDKDRFGPSLGYSRQIYVVTNQTGKQIELKKKYFENFPKNTKLHELKINNNTPRESLSQSKGQVIYF